MKETAVTVKNEAGIHVRPSGIIADAMNKYSGTVIFLRNGKKTTYSSVLDIIAMGLQKGDTLRLLVSGDDEINFVKKIKKLFQTHFDFPPKN